MNAYIKRCQRRRQRGAAAVELALILIFSGFLLPVVFLFSRVFYHYSVIKQATQDAANYMAVLPRIEMVTPAGMALAQVRAKDIVKNAIAEAGIKPPEDLIIDVRCNNNASCVSSIAVEAVQVEATFILVDDFWQDTGPWLPDAFGSSWTFSASSDAIYQN
jgi:Flp pilus assembly protein TadG